MKKIYTPVDEMELAIIRSMLDSAEIPYRVINQYFGSLYIGPAMGSLNSKPVMVPEEYFEEARAVLAEFITADLNRPEENTESAVREKRIFDDLGELLESAFRTLFRR